MPYGYFRIGHNYAKDVDNLIEVGFISKFFLGIVLAAPFIWYGVMCITTQSGYMIGRHGAMKLNADSAIAWGVAVIGIGAAIHFRFFWRHTRFLMHFTDFGIVASLAAFAGGIGYVVVRFMATFYG